MLKVLVTGGAGYVGSVLCGKLLKADMAVTVLDRLTYGSQPLLPYMQVNYNDTFACVKGDVRDANLVKELVQRHDVVLHLAAVVGYPACAADPAVASETNVQGSRNVASAISKHQVFVYASTGSTYGMVNGICTEDTPISPLSHYGHTKAEAEKICLGAGATCLRFATVFGGSPCMRFDLLINNFVFHAVRRHYLVLYEGCHRRTFIHVHDAAKSYLHSIDNYDKLRGNIFNVGANQLNLTKREAADAVAKLYPMYIHEASIGKDADCRNYAVDYSKFNATGFAADVSLDQGIKEVGAIAENIQIANPWRLD